MMARAVDFSISFELRSDLKQWRTRAGIAGIAGAVLTAIGFFLTSPNQFYRSYLWSYPAGIDWFVCLADQEPALGRDILRAAYGDPLTPAELAAMWPDGPRVGGPGGSIDVEP